MKRNITFTDDYAVSEVVGGLLLLLIALITFSIIYMHVFPLPIPPPEPNVKLVGYVNNDGFIVVKHTGGESLPYYRIDVRHVNGTLINTESHRDKDNPWKIGECAYPHIGTPLITEDQSVRVTIYSIYEDGAERPVFDGILKGKISGSPTTPSGPLMLISSLRTNTIDEDLICYNYTTDPDALTYIYNWIVDGDSIMNLLMPFDTNSLDSVEDYSGNERHGTITGASWTSNGRVGGAYSFDGDDYISLPYCSDSSYIEELTVESWIKTGSPTGTIASFDRTKYWGLGVNNGKVQWTTTASDGTTDTVGISAVDDGAWHYVAATYDSLTGESKIYIDGETDKTEIGHIPEEELGSGDTPAGSIGKDVSSIERETIFPTSFETQEEKNSWREHNKTGDDEEESWDNLRYDDFNSGWGSYTDGGWDCHRRSDYKHEGSHSARIRDNSGWSSSFYLTNGIDVHTPEYTSITIDFWWMWNGGGWRSGEDWWIHYYDGSSWSRVLDKNYPSGYSKDTWYHEIIYINETDYNFPTDMKIRFQCDASRDNDRVYIDQIYINATIGGRKDYDFDLRDSEELNPRTGTYSIGGTGDFDPEYVAFNRTDVDISNYNDVNVSVWYSYKDTESTDFIGFYYLDNDEWKVIFEVDNPQSIGQKEWAHAEVQIPGSIDNLILQFKWITSSTSGYMAIDDLEITGLPTVGWNNFSGLIDEFRIYNRALSEEQIYQNYLCTKDGYSDKSVIVSEETVFGNAWKCIVTPNNSIQDGSAVESDLLNIVMHPGGG